MPYRISRKNVSTYSLKSTNRLHNILPSQALRNYLRKRKEKLHTNKNQPVNHNKTSLM